jgi:hypothetical protein
MPGEDVLCALGEFLGVSGPVSVEGYPHNNYWDADHGEAPLSDDGIVSVVDDEPAFELSGDSIREILAAHSSHRPVFALISFEDSAWLSRLCSEVQEQVTSGLSDGYAPFDLNWELGPWSCPDPWEESTIATGLFRITIGGDGCPTDPDEFMKSVARLPSAQALNQWLHNSCGLNWEWLADVT